MNTLLNFFREGTKESSTRLVGIGCFVAATFLASFVITAATLYAKPISPATVTVIGLIYIQGGIALGLRKVTEPKPEAES